MSHAAQHPDPRKITNIEAQLRALNIEIETLYQTLSDAHRRRIARLPTSQPLWPLRERLATLHEQFDLLISEYERRRI